MKSDYANTVVVIPSFNEEASVAHVIREVRECLPDITILVVNDGSIDATAAIAANSGALVASLPFNLGVGAAMRLGFVYALEHNFANVVQVDADGQHDPQGIPALVDALKEADLVLGARFAGEGSYKVRGPRRWMMKILASILSKTSKTKLTDTTSGFKASGPKAVELFATHYPAEYLGDTIEALVIASRCGLTIRQIPVAMRPRTGGVPSHNPFKSFTYLFRAVVALSFAFIRPSSIYHVRATHDSD